MNKKIHYTADQCHTGGYECKHKHRTYEAARRCVPSLPTGPGNNGVFSMAQVHKYVDGEEVNFSIDDAE